MTITASGALAVPYDADTLRMKQQSQAVGGMDLNAIKHASPEKIEAVSKEFEAMFVSQMLENMFSTVDVKEGLGGSDAEETYQSMMVSEYGKLIARTGGIGVADQIKRDMLKLQEAK